MEGKGSYIRLACCSISLLDGSGHPSASATGLGANVSKMEQAQEASIALLDLCTTQMLGPPLVDRVNDHTYVQDQHTPAVSYDLTEGPHY